MKKMKKVLSLAMVSAMTISLLTGCGKKGSTETGSSSDDTIKIAVAAPMTGDNAEYGQGFLNAANMMAEEWNAKGGVLGKQVDIVPYDDKNSSEEAATIAQKIVSAKDIVGVIGHFASGVCMTAAPVYEENKIIEISPSASHKDYSGIGDYIFRNNTVISTEAKASLDIAVNNFGKKNIGIISIKTDWGTGTAQVIKDLATELGSDGVKVVAHEEVVEGSDDYSPAITKLNEAGADVVICAGMYNLVAPVAKQYKRVNPDIKIVGFSNAYSQQLIELGGEDVEGVGFPVIFFSGSEDPAIKEYVEKYKSKFGNEPSALTSQAYDSVGMLLTAIQEAGTTDSAKVREALTGVQYPGVAGDTKFDETGDVQKEFVKVTIENGKFVQMK
ncbi:ABC transporter substrate-binding protein [Anaerocolumna sp.]|uniref:ABC transporter substrate-binding protein n=1 Tax=Anaerocolumna sp. TaxID=2041569 RepID=UPI0028AF7BEF|nr:ABC transporter substrate-binding protein [Anaerocolumna sp.]